MEPDSPREPEWEDPRNDEQTVDVDSNSTVYSDAEAGVGPAVQELLTYHKSSQDILYEEEIKELKRELKKMRERERERERAKEREHLRKLIITLKRVILGAAGAASKLRVQRDLADFQEAVTHLEKCWQALFH